MYTLETSFLKVEKVPLSLLNGFLAGDDLLGSQWKGWHRVRLEAKSTGRSICFIMPWTTTITFRRMIKWQTFYTRTTLISKKIMESVFQKLYFLAKRNEVYIDYYFGKLPTTADNLMLGTTLWEETASRTNTLLPCLQSLKTLSVFTFS